MKYACGLLLSVWYLNCTAELAPQIIALNCFNCHQTTTESTEYSIPNFGNLSSAQLLQALLDFKYDRKPATLMPRIAKGYSDSELAALANFLSQQ